MVKVKIRNESSYPLASLRVKMRMGKDIKFKNIRVGSTVSVVIKDKSQIHGFQVKYDKKMWFDPKWNANFKVGAANWGTMYFRLYFKSLEFYGKM